MNERLLWVKGRTEVDVKAFYLKTRGTGLHFCNPPPNEHHLMFEVFEAPASGIFVYFLKHLDVVTGHTEIFSSDNVEYISILEKTKDFLARR
jgi:hypothetical protein